MRYNDAIQRCGTTMRYNDAIQRCDTTMRYNDAVTKTKGKEQKYPCITYESERDNEIQ